MSLLHQQPTPAENGGQGAVLPVNGKKLSRRRKRVSRKLRARLAAKLQNGTAYVANLTAAQACGLCDVTPAELATAKRRVAKRNGNGNKHQDRLFYRRSPTDTDLDVAVAQHGPRLMAALDRATKPRCQQTTEMFSAAR